MKDRNGNEVAVGQKIKFVRDGEEKRGEVIEVKEVAGNYFTTVQVKQGQASYLQMLHSEEFEIGPKKHLADEPTMTVVAPKETGFKKGDRVKFDQGEGEVIALAVLCGQTMYLIGVGKGDLSGGFAEKFERHASQLKKE